jgi:hypothetical protein
MNKKTTSILETEQTLHLIDTISYELRRVSLSNKL